MKLKYGYLFIEIAVVLGLIILLATLAMPHMQFMRNAHVKANLETVASFIRFCSQKAMVSNKTIPITFNIAESSYFGAGFSYALSPGVIFGTVDHALGPPSSPSHPIHHPIHFPHDTIYCYPDGKISAGSLYITNADKTVLAALTIPIGALLYLRKYRYDNGRWNILT